ncbi:hypothetical protein NLJ89_g10349 [Agrocybe chaxingu]|uniref:Uncharacterized protein n=1 Tax=Agrocybe chaxingu TaxID=84603 RepID=A0A9W8JQS2_9AGAR|nr:hypothetical protein NLJ89_g10349 [Agrocybe chaxingu]
MAFISPISMKGPAEVAHGWMFIGFVFNTLLLGVTITQVYMYYTKYKEDRPFTKALVAFVFILDIMNTTFLCVLLYRSLITFYGEPEFLTKADWLLAADAWTTGLIASTVQSFFAWRILRLTKNWIYVVVIGALAIAGGVASIMTAVETVRVQYFSEFRSFKAIVIVYEAAEVIGDIVITTVLVWHLLNSRHGLRGKYTSTGSRLESSQGQANLAASGQMNLSKKIQIDAVNIETTKTHPEAFVGVQSHELHDFGQGLHAKAQIDSAFRGVR